MLTKFNKRPRRLGSLLKSSFQTAARPVQPFLHSLQVSPAHRKTDRQTDRQTERPRYTYNNKPHLASAVMQHKSNNTCILTDCSMV